MMNRYVNYSAVLTSLAIAFTLSAVSDLEAQVRGGRGGGGRSGGHTAPSFQRPANSGFNVNRPANSHVLPGNANAGNLGGARAPSLPKPGVGNGNSNSGSKFQRPNLENPKLPSAAPGIGRPGEVNPGGVSRPNLPNVTRPGTGPSTGQLNDFLGIANKPNGGVGSSGPIADRLPERKPDNRPNIQKPNIDKDNVAKIGDRIGESNNINVGNVNVGNSIDFSKDRNAWIKNVHSSGDHIRAHAGNRFTGIYANGRYRYGVVGGYRYYAGWTTLGPYYGWRPITFVSLGTFIGATWANATPVYYAYGTGGNVYYENNIVYVNDQPAGTPTEYAAQAAALVSAAPEKTDESEWMPLGVFALTQEGVDDAQTMIELAVNKAGIVAGTYCNEATKVSRSLKGTVDKNSQRVAVGFADGKNSALVFETGVQNLTQDEAPGLLHYGADMSVPVLLVRLTAPAE